MAQGITVAKFRDVADGLQEGQFAIGDRETLDSLDALDPIYKDLLDRPITITLGLIGPDGRVGGRRVERRADARCCYVRT